MKCFDALLAVELEEARGLLRKSGLLTIQERTALLAERLFIDPEEAHELVYIVEGWRKARVLSEAKPRTRAI
jgi:hypothetical protein